MKTTRLILALAAALSLGLAVFANVRTHGSVTVSTQSIITSDELATSSSDADVAVTGIKVAADGDPGCLTDVAVTGIKVAADGDPGCLTSPGQSSKNIAT
jgi:hypothetical protein